MNSTIRSLTRSGVLEYAVLYKALSSSFWPSRFVYWMMGSRMYPTTYGIGAVSVDTEPTSTAMPSSSKGLVKE